MRSEVKRSKAEGQSAGIREKGSADQIMQKRTKCAVVVSPKVNQKPNESQRRNGDTAAPKAVLTMNQPTRVALDDTVTRRASARTTALDHRRGPIMLEAMARKRSYHKRRPRNSTMHDWSEKRKSG